MAGHIQHDHKAPSLSRGAVLDIRPNCTACDLQDEALSFCQTCKNYLCGECLKSHQKMSVMFKGHEIISVQDIIEGNVSIGDLSEKCLTHKRESKNIFCQVCNELICHECVAVGHRNHETKSKTDFQKELQVKVSDLIQRCKDKKSISESHIREVERQRYFVTSYMQTLRTNANKAYTTKSKRLEEDLRILLEQIEALEREFNDNLNSIVSNNQKRIKSISSSMTLVANDKLSRLDTDSLSAHTWLCDELHGMLKETTVDTSRTMAEAITNRACIATFWPAHNTRLELGILLEPKLQIIQIVPLGEHEVKGMTKYSNDSVAVGFYNTPPVVIVDSSGKTKTYANIPRDAYCHDLVFRTDKTLCLTSYADAVIYSPKGSRKSTIRVPHGNLARLNKSPSDEILITNGSTNVYIYDPTGSTLKHTVTTTVEELIQASATREGLIITGNENTVAVHDRDGNVGNYILDNSPRHEGVRLCAAVDEQDRVYIATVDCKYGSLSIKLYDLDGLNLKERVWFRRIDLQKGMWGYCRLVSLSPDMLAFVHHGHTLYFIKNCSKYL